MVPKGEKCCVRIRLGCGKSSLAVPIGFPAGFAPVGWNWNRPYVSDENQDDSHRALRRATNTSYLQESPVVLYIDASNNKICYYQIQPEYGDEQADAGRDD